MRLALLTAIVLTTGLLLAGSASASTVCVVGGVATFAAGDVASGACSGQPSTASETNQLTIDAYPGGDIVFTDPGSTVSDGDGAGGCTAAGNTGTCPGVSTYRFELGAGDDTAVVHSFAGTGVSTGGPGNDTLTGGALADNF